MKGTVHIIEPNGGEVIVEFDRPPGLERLQEWVGGYIEIVPRFTKFRDQRCVAFCNEEGKLHGLPLNLKASEHWHANMPGIEDTLRGPVAILYGDEEWMDEL